MQQQDQWPLAGFGDVHAQGAGLDLPVGDLKVACRRVRHGGRIALQQGVMSGMSPSYQVFLANCVRKGPRLGASSLRCLPSFPVRVRF